MKGGFTFFKDFFHTQYSIKWLFTPQIQNIYHQMYLPEPWSKILLQNTFLSPPNAVSVISLRLLGFEYFCLLYNCLFFNHFYWVFFPVRLFLRFFSAEFSDLILFEPIWYLLLRCRLVPLVDCAQVRWTGHFHAHLGPLPKGGGQSGEDQSTDPMERDRSSPLSH